ncbi:hypothetical protein ACH5RR_000971 [Cinchona calisaya]|uniref:Tf2-1-like SH3-like domain-containing protein n=1 Tax=Cinchona calisaya TaxID=153742 RepID=A0ABD3B2M9_9GENT
MSPFEASYGYKPKHLPVGNHWESIALTASNLIQERQAMVQILQQHLQVAQSRMKFYADRNKTESELAVGEMVYLKLQPYRQNSVEVRKQLKLSSKFYGPFPVLKRIGKVAYKLQLPAGSRLHPVFHVSQLKKKLGTAQVAMSSLPSVGLDDHILTGPEAVLKRKVIMRNGTPIILVLIRWCNLSPEESTWEDLDFIRSQFPDFKL